MTWPAYINILITSDDQARRVDQLSKEFEVERKLRKYVTREELYQRIGELMELLRCLPAEPERERPAPSAGLGGYATEPNGYSSAPCPMPNCVLWRDHPGLCYPGTANEEPKAEPSTPEAKQSESIETITCPACGAITTAWSLGIQRVRTTNCGQCGYRFEPQEPILYVPLRDDPCPKPNCLLISGHPGGCYPGTANAAPPMSIPEQPAPLPPSAVISQDGNTCTMIPEPEAKQ
jgi:hypothetical protein